MPESKAQTAQQVGISEKLVVGLLRFFFYLLYQPFAWTYDAVAAAVSLGRWKRWVLAVLDDISGPTLLELGHGPGHLSAAARQKGVQVAALDRSWQMSRLAFRRHKKLSVVSGLVNGYAQNLPFPTASFRQVAATFPSEYFWEPATLLEIARVLEPEGELLVLPVAWITGNSWPDRAARWLFSVTSQAPDPADSRWLESLRTRLEQAGFAVQTEYRSLETSTLLLVRARSIAPA